MMFLQLYGIAFVVFLLIDAIWLGLVAPKFYKSQIGHLMAEKPNFIAALIFYLLFIVVLLISIPRQVAAQMNMDSAMALPFVKLNFGIYTPANDFL